MSEEATRTAPAILQMREVCLRTFSGHQDLVRSYASSPDGQRVLSSSLDGAIMQWDVDSGECQRILHLLPEGASVVLAGNGILHAWGEAWRWFGWRWQDSRTGKTRILPAEHFGPLPN